MSYIQEHKEEQGCVFCVAQTQPDGVENLILHRGKYTYVILNRYPYTSGHLMVVPFIHRPNLEDLNPETRAEMVEQVTQCVRVLREEYRAEGFNVGLNIGDAAGAGIPGHIHFHIVPRWKGDTNFMSSLGQVRVVPEALAETYQRLKKAWDADSNSRTIGYSNTQRKGDKT
jgi:ATP adenylyltransferase